MKRAKALAAPVRRLSFIYLEPFRCNSPLKCASQPKIAKKYENPQFWGYNVIQGHRC